MLAVVMTGLPLSLTAQNNGNVLDLKYSIEDSSIVFPESYETDCQKMLEGWYLKNYTSTDDRYTQADPGASEETIRRRLAALPTVIDMPCNPIVVEYIERYTKKGRPQLAAILGLSTYYMPIFEQALEEAGLPMELKYLPVIESALNPNAVSKHGAAGLWQFIVGSAKGYDMEVNSLIDERRDPYVSSQKACQFLKSLYDTYGDWSLAIAAYNCGPGNVNKALTRAGGTPKTLDFWNIYYYLPQETRGYVPMFIAANYVMNYYPEHNISPVLPTKPLITDTIHVSDRVHFEQICAVLDIPIDELRILNPQFRADIIPGSAEHPYNLILPSQQTHAYLVSEQQIHDYERDKYARKINAVPGGDPAAEEDASEMLLAQSTSEAINPADLAPAEEAAAAETVEILENAISEEVTTPRHRRGGTKENRQTTTDNSSKDTKKPVAESAKTDKKQTADTSTTKKNTKQPASTETAKKKDTKKSAKTSSHTVKSGENLTVIAKKYGVTVQELEKANPAVKNGAIKPDQKLTIPSASKSKSAGSKSAGTKSSRKKSKKK